MDSYEPKEFHFNIKASADAQFNNIQTMYIGRNESMSEGFTGCISRVEFDDIYPLKLLFQEDGPANVRSLGCKCLWFVHINTSAKPCHILPNVVPESLVTKHPLTRCLPNNQSECIARFDCV